METEKLRERDGILMGNGVGGGVVVVVVYRLIVDIGGYVCLLI